MPQGLVTCCSVDITVIQYFYRLYAIESYYKIVAIFPCVVQYILIAYLFYAHSFGSRNLRP